MLEDTSTPPPPLSLGDIGFILFIIDTVSKRGAFAGEELQLIGTYRTKVETWLKHNTSQGETASTPAAVAIPE